MGSTYSVGTVGLLLKANGGWLIMQISWGISGTFTPIFNAHKVSWSNLRVSCGSKTISYERKSALCAIEQCNPVRFLICTHKNISLITRFLEPTWGPSGADRTQVGPMLASWTLLSGIINVNAWSATDLHKNTMVILVRYWFGETAQQRKTWFSRHYLINVTFRRYIDIYISTCETTRIVTLNTMRPVSTSNKSHQCD